MNEISVCIITRNEEEYIGRAIRSITPYVKEVIVVDHYSEDRTFEIARSLGAKVFRKSWNSDFSESRNFSISQASCPLILVMDADEEYLDDGLALQDASQLVSSEPGTAASVGIQSLTSNGQWVQSWITRLFPNHSDFKYKGRIHEQLHYKSQYPKLVSTVLNFNHYGYSPEEIKKKDKYQRNLELLLLDQGSDPENPYLMFQLGKTYGKMNELLESKVWFERALGVGQKPYPHFYSALFMEYAHTLLKLKDWESLSNIINVAIEIYPDYTDLYYIYGSAIIEAKNPEWFDQIPDVFSYCIHLGEVPRGKYESVQGVGSYRSHYNLGLYYELTGNTSEALYHYEMSGQQGFDQAKDRIKLLNYNKK
ncbi:hypothetical protein DCC85_20055 [Paenibacillus sp. CAA11]|uniref:tetratricopeptide repeat-containing glycosyltransferase family 2 protein n=1 Tax=Paenibacillus sp. CAA11 TaxID=1532905 RepID=UPI000D3BBC61|nr:glycosyltransferase family 2 protein [Paenibacillus sp. CAA11]AWB46226.1 hypothetical protein DCC85_20055 [Paenibacillus sp. CAA11]